MSVSSIPPANQFIDAKENNKNNNDPVTNLQNNNKQTADTKKNISNDKENKTTSSENATTKSADLAKIVAKNKMV